MQVLYFGKTFFYRFTQNNPLDCLESSRQVGTRQNHFVSQLFFLWFLMSEISHQAPTTRKAAELENAVMRANTKSSFVCSG